MNTNMWNDLNNALMVRLVGTVSNVTVTLQGTGGENETAETLRARAEQLETDMGRLQTVFRYIRHDQFEPAYNLLDTIGKPADGAETPPETPPPTDPTAPLEPTVEV